MKWVKATEFESKIILALGRKKKSQSEIARDIKRNPKAVRTTVSRLEEQGIINRSKDYVKDSRISLIELEKKKIKIKRTNHFYQIFFIIQLLTMISSLIVSAFLRKYENFIFIWFSAFSSIFPSSIYMAYKVFITKDRIVVYKNTLERGRYNKKNIENK